MSPWVWILLLLLVIFIVWWAITAQARQYAEENRIPAHHTEPTPVVVDDLTIIEGIGPKIAGILAAAGITSFSQLATTDAKHIREILLQSGLRLADPQSWAEQARLAEAGDWDGLKSLQDHLKAGRVIV